MGSLPRSPSADLAAFHGTSAMESAWRHQERPVHRGGSSTWPTRAGAYWLLDAIAIAQACDRRVAAEGLQVWVLVVHDDQQRHTDLRGWQRAPGSPSSRSRSPTFHSPTPHPVVCGPGHHAPE